MSDKQILNEWNKITELYNIEYSNLQTYMQETDGKIPKEEMLKHYNEVSKKLNILQSEANKLIAQYYTLNYNRIINTNNSHKRSA